MSIIRFIFLYSLLNRINLEKKLDELIYDYIWSVLQEKKRGVARNQWVTFSLRKGPRKYFLRREFKNMITQKQKLRIRKEFSTKKPTVWIGKNGITEEFIGNLLKQFEKNEVVKIKILKSFLKTNSAIEIADKIIKQTDSILIEIRGHSFILFRKRKT